MWWKVFVKHSSYHTALDCHWTGETEFARNEREYNWEMIFARVSPFILMIRKRGKKKLKFISYMINYNIQDYILFKLHFILNSALRFIFHFSLQLELQPLLPLLPKSPHEDTNHHFYLDDVISFYNSSFHFHLLLFLIKIYFIRD